jgi:hypothetical protein
VQWAGRLRGCGRAQWDNSHPNSVVGAGQAAGAPPARAPRRVVTAADLWHEIRLCADQRGVRAARGGLPALPGAGPPDRARSSCRCHQCVACGAGPHAHTRTPLVLRDSSGAAECAAHASLAHCHCSLRRPARLTAPCAQHTDTRSKERVSQQLQRLARVASSAVAEGHGGRAGAEQRQRGERSAGARAPSAAAAAAPPPGQEQEAGGGLCAPTRWVGWVPRWVLHTAPAGRCCSWRQHALCVCVCPVCVAPAPIRVPTAPIRVPRTHKTHKPHTHRAPHLCGPARAQDVSQEPARAGRPVTL